MSFFTENQYIQWMEELSENDYVILDDFVDRALFNKLFSFFKERIREDELKTAGIGTLGDHTVDKRIRGDFVFWLDRDRDVELSQFYGRVDELIFSLKRYCFLPISDFEFHLAYYPPGSFYKKHIDQFKERNNRLISFVLYLNEDWKEGDGGELVVYKDDQTIKIPPKAGRLTLFKSDVVPHEVAVTQKDRYSLTGWLLNNPVGLGFLQY